METTETEQKTRLFAYCRESVDLKSGIEIQKEKIIKYCEAYDIEVVKWIIENDASAFKPRSKYSKMMDDIFNNDVVDGIICSSLTRFGRKSAELIVANEKLTDHGKRLVMVDNNIDSTTINGKAMLSMMAVFAQLERDTTFQRITDGRKRAMMVGTKSGKPMHRPNIEIDWKEYDRYYKLGLSTNAISKIVKDANTGKHISSSALYNAVKNRDEHNKNII